MRLPPHMINKLMFFVVRRLLKLERQRKPPLNVCLIDLPNECDSVDRNLLWEVLTRSGVPIKLVTIIPQFHDSIRARVRTDEAERS